ncbi:DUF397 domain-containing protein [Kitasatospora sp. NBC_01266]|uniref:DUF397 domain-containing protein n=1 Tax=Kitasatospora sp. NBC_01266 TaxID=2903572 RepID=UPI002E313F98|nr:DUF397 domain-containing protein [Kitasatospora sp. NBC_01266]
MTEINETGAQWVKSTFSENGGNCLEVATNFTGVVPVRDSKDPSGPALAVTVAAWASFVAEVKAGEFGTV